MPFFRTFVLHFCLFFCIFAFFCMNFEVDDAKKKIGGVGYNKVFKIYSIPIKGSGGPILYLAFIMTHKPKNSATTCLNKCPTVKMTYKIELNLLTNQYTPHVLFCDIFFKYLWRLFLHIFCDNLKLKKGMGCMS